MNNEQTSFKMSEAIKFFVLNLDRSKSRLHAAEHKFKDVGLSFERVSGVDGKDLNIHDHKNYDDIRCRLHLGRSIRAGELGCYLGHLKALEAFLQSDARYGVIIEDDFKFIDGFQEKLSRVLEWLDQKEHPENQEKQPHSKGLHWDLLHLSARKIHQVTALQSFGFSTLYRAHYFPMSGVGILWTRNGAKRYLDASKTLWSTFDAFNRSFYTRNQRGLCLYEPLVLPDGKTGKSDILGIQSTYENHPLKVLIHKRRLIVEKTIATWFKIKALLSNKA